MKILKEDKHESEDEAWMEPEYQQLRYSPRERYYLLSIVIDGKLQIIKITDLDIANAERNW